MKISAKTDYACRALLELSLHWPNQVPLRVNEIAQRQNILMKFLIHILISLKQVGLVQSLRGNKGGYILAKAPQDITMAELVAHFAERRIQRSMVAKKFKKSDVMETIWVEIDNNVYSIMNKINFEEICRRHRNTEKIPMYTI